MPTKPIRIGGFIMLLGSNQMRDKIYQSYEDVQQKNDYSEKPTHRCHIIPPHITKHLADHSSAPHKHTNHLHAKELRFKRNECKAQTESFIADISSRSASTAPVAAILVYDAKHSQHTPGKKVKLPYAKLSDADNAANGAKATADFYQTIFNRNSIDDRGMAIISTINYETGFDNAFWDGKQMVYGNGDNITFNDFTTCIDVIGHELTHGVDQYTFNLLYEGQSGALNESYSDVFGSMVKQFKLQQTADTADWLIGDGLLKNIGDKHYALRSMKAPGTGYINHPDLGTDPQPATMDAYVVLANDDANDDGGVHINSGIPNHAFYLAATQLKGHSWEKAGKVWYDVMNNRKIKPTATFKDFATATILSAKTLFPQDPSVETAMHYAWAAVKVLQ